MSFPNPKLDRRDLAKVALGGALGATTVAAAGPAAAAADTHFRVGYLNIKNSLTRAKFNADLREVTSRADLVGLGECSDRRDRLRRFAANNGWHLWQPAGFFKGETPILARKDRFTRPLDKGVIFAGDTNGMGVAPPARYIVWATFRERSTGRKITVINSHANAGIDDNGHPTNIPRTRDAEKHFAKLRKLAAAKRATSQVVVVGDLNVDYVDDRRVKHGKFPFTVLEERNRSGAIPGLRSSYSQLGVTNRPTHGHRHIDYVYEWVRVPSHRVMKAKRHYVFRANSDHNGIVVRFWLKGKG